MGLAPCAEDLDLGTEVHHNRIPLHDSGVLVGGASALRLVLEGALQVPCGRKRKRHKIATHKRKKKLRKNRHKKK